MNELTSLYAILGMQPHMETPKYYYQTQPDWTKSVRQDDVRALFEAAAQAEKNKQTQTNQATST